VDKSDRPQQRIHLVVPTDWTPLPTAVAELTRAAKAAADARGLGPCSPGRRPDHFLQAVWQAPGSPVQLGGCWDWVHADFTTLDWPLPQRGPRACHIDTRGGRILVYNPTGRMDNGGRVVFNVQWRLQPASAKQPAPSPSAPHRRTNADNDAARNAVLGELPDETLPEPPIPPSGKPGPIPDDGAALDEARRLLAEGKARSRSDAAKQVLHLAPEHGGTRESKQKRLVRKLGRPA
jgi:hypothetical protein